MSDSNNSFKSGMILSNIQKYPSLAFLITARYFACTYNLQVSFFSPAIHLGSKKETKKLHPENMFAGERMMALDSEINWTEQNVMTLAKHRLWPVSACDLAAGPVTELISNLWIAEKSWAMKAGIHRFVPGVSTVRRNRDIPHVGWEIKSRKSLVVLHPSRPALPAGRCFPHLPSHSSPWSAHLHLGVHLGVQARKPTPRACGKIRPPCQPTG